jgi:outer membrane protein assembly factor BamB
VVDSSTTTFGEVWVEPSDFRFFNNSREVIMASLLESKRSLGFNAPLVSPNGRFELILQSDGNLVLYRLTDGKALWDSKTYGRSVMIAIMQGDGNLVLYDCNFAAVFASNTSGNPGSFLLMQDDGNVVIYRPNPPPIVPIWATGTGQ